MSKFYPINILDLLESVPEKEISDALLSFKCAKNEEIESYIHKNAIDFSKRKISVTHLVLDDKANIVGYFTLTHKPARIPADLLSNTSIKKIEKYAKIDEGTNSYDASAFLIAQFGKNSNVDSSLSGDEMMDMAISVLLKAQRQIGGGIVFLECENKENLLNFYQNENNRFVPYGERFSEKENITYKQLLRLF